MDFKKGRSVKDVGKSSLFLPNGRKDTFHEGRGHEEASFLFLATGVERTKKVKEEIVLSLPLPPSPPLRPPSKKLSPPEEALMPVNVRRRREKSFGPSPSRPPLLDEKLYFDKKRGECRT